MQHAPINPSIKIFFMCVFLLFAILSLTCWLTGRDLRSSSPAGRRYNQRQFSDFVISPLQNMGSQTMVWSRPGPTDTMPVRMPVSTAMRST